MNICIYKHNPRIEVTAAIMDAYIRAFQKLKHNVLIISPDLINESTDQVIKLAKTFVDLEADLAICYGFSAMPQINGTYFFRKHSIPLVVLCFENPYFGLTPALRDEIKRYPDYYHFFIWDSFYLDLLHQELSNCYPIHHATEFHELGTAGRLYESVPDKDIAFVGNMTDFVRLRASRIQNKNSLNGVIDEVMLAKINNPALNVIEILRDALSRRQTEDGTGIKASEKEDFFHNKIIFPLYEEGLGRYRYHVLNQLEMFNIHYYGNMSWNAPHIEFHPPVDYYKELPQIYRSTKINLDIPPFQSIHAPNNRLFDVAAAGSLILTERKSGVAEIFDDTESIVYMNIEDLKEKIRFYLGNDHIRRQISYELHNLIVNKHTYTHRAEYILDTLRP
ncbi:MAG: glycosyltransferase [Deltaproteobacteria bacterium]|nr:glycosyltransferase [Deltaproteobacteria bacterium]MBW2154399.1 glycosyltransferase [Deltaproteobacteria bacterium]